MKKLQLDFNLQPTRTPWLGLLLCVLGVIAVLWVMTQIDVAKEQKNQLELQEDSIALRIKQRDSKIKAELNASPVSAKVEKIRRDQLLSHAPAFDLLERVWEKEIAFSRLEIATVERDIKMDLEAKSLNDVLLLVDRFEAAPETKHVTLARNSLKIGDPQRPAVAAIEVLWLADPAVPTNNASAANTASRPSVHSASAASGVH
ncbi:hypothetical protein [Deefgea sp. CFH1-16]|uniref:hypothetical protein n=1 Tax=Deefgea sp. CFH1-16 TaxID=2675457 RepID=UPI0015F77A76|nr:hypothetical protein [Deefgea sp. CFH1-16]MBM5573672.1 hypothetical protein [Deefgea sp. CFH1-16]